MRGTVVHLTADQRRTRMLWLVGEATADTLDPFVDVDRRLALVGKVTGYTIKPDYETKCCDGFYLLKDHNGGKDPTAIDPFDRWNKPGETFINRTADCIGGMTWCGGFDRYQPQRFSHLYDGWINTDSMIEDAHGPRKCFHVLDRPEPGCFVVFASGSAGHAIGHIGGITDVPTDWEPHAVECWRGLGVVDMAARTGRGNRRGDPMTWYYAGGVFVVSTMQP